MGVSVSAKLSEMVSEARVKSLIEEEQHLEATDVGVLSIKLETLGLIDKMETARENDNEEDRRKYRNEIVVKNLRLVTQVLKKYGYFSQDKFQNGCVGLLKAAETFDSNKGVPFPNYACFCIETEVRLAFKRVNRAFEGKKKGFLDSLDSPASLANGDEVDKHDLAIDPFAEQEFDAYADEAELDTLFYDIIIPSIQQYGVRAKDIDMDLWQNLEIQYFIELSLEHSQRQRITFTEMAAQLKTTPQNIRIRHKKVTDIVKNKLIDFGYNIAVSSNGRARVVRTYKEDGQIHTKRIHKKHTRKR